MRRLSILFLSLFLLLSGCAPQTPEPPAPEPPPEAAAPAKPVPSQEEPPEKQPEAASEDTTLEIVLPEEYLAPWQGREVWLECALDGATITVTAKGSAVTPLPYPELESYRHRDTNLCCHYEIDITEKRAQFHLSRTHDDLHDLLAIAEKINVTHAIGLFQELDSIVR